MNRQSNVVGTADDGRPSLAWLLLSGLGGALAALVVAGVLAGRLNIPISGPLLLGAALLGGLPRLAALARGRWAARWPELIAALIAFAALAGVGLALAWPSLLPLGLSVDAVHHTQLLDWLAAHRAFPPTDGDTQGLLGEMIAYPTGLALVVLAAATLAARPPLEAMYPTVALLGGLIAATVSLLSSVASEWKIEHERLKNAGPGSNILNSQFSILNFLALLVGPLLLLAHRTYTLEAYTYHSYYTMVLGVLLVLLAAGWLLVEPRLAWGGAAQLGLILAALMCTYPLWAPLPIALAVAVIVSRTNRRRLIINRSKDKETGRQGESGYAARPISLSPHLLVSQLSAVALALGPALLLTLLDVLPRLRVGQIVLAHEGVVALPTAQALAPIGLALPCALLIARGSRGRWLAGLAGLALLMTGGLALAARSGLAASYHSYKMLFVLTPLAAAIVGAGVARLAAIPRRAIRLPALGAAALLLALAGSFRVVPPPAIQVLSPDVVAAARWLRASSPDAAKQAIVVGAPAGPLAYWLQVGLLGQRRDRAALAMEAFTTPPASPERWLIEPRLPSTVIAPQLGQPLPGTTTTRFGAAAVVRRDGPLDMAALNPLTIRYRTFWEEERLKTAIEALQPLPGRLPLVELCVYHDGAPLNVFALQPDPARTSTQYLGADVLPATLGGIGYINTSAYPTFAPPPAAPSGTFSLTLRLALDGHPVEERLLATFDRAPSGQFEQIRPYGGELTYLRSDTDSGKLRDSALDFGDAMRLTGWSGPARVTPETTLAVELRWQALQPLDRSLLTEVQVLDSGGQPVAASLEAPQGGFYPTWRWRPGESVTEQRRIWLPPDLTPGRYRLAVRVYDFGERSGALSAGSGGAAQIGEFVVER